MPQNDYRNKNLLFKGFTERKSKTKNENELIKFDETFSFNS